MIFKFFLRVLSMIRAVKQTKLKMGKLNVSKQNDKNDKKYFKGFFFIDFLYGLPWKTSALTHAVQIPIV